MVSPGPMLQEYIMSNPRLRLVQAIGAALLMSVGLAWLPGMPAQEKQDRAQDKQDQKVITNSVGMKLVRIPAGKFVMGSPKEEKARFDNEDQHEVEITKAFYMGMYTVTQSEYVQVMDKNPSHFREVAGMDTGRFPVESVSWDDAVKFCEELSNLRGEKAAGRKYRLPTEAEWEYACRAGTTTAYHYGDTLSADQANIFERDAAKGMLMRPTKVGSFQPNAFGLYDMHGNVWQLCKDSIAVKHPAGKDPEITTPHTHRVVRGGSWLNPASSARSSQRLAGMPTGHPGNYVGFRVVATK